MVFGHATGLYNCISQLLQQPLGEQKMAGRPWAPRRLRATGKRVMSKIFAIFSWRVGRVSNREQQGYSPTDVTHKIICIYPWWGKEAASPIDAVLCIFFVAVRQEPQTMKKRDLSKEENVPKIPYQAVAQ